MLLQKASADESCSCVELSLSGHRAVMASSTCSRWLRRFSGRRVNGVMAFRHLIELWLPLTQKIAMLDVL
jgi:hypothetical protein